MKKEIQGYQTQVFVGDNGLIGALRHVMDPIVAFTLEIWGVVVKKYKLKGGARTLRWFA